MSEAEAKVVKPEELLKELASYDLAIAYDRDLAPLLKRPSELRPEELGLAGVAFSERGEILCWSAHDGEYKCERIVWPTAPGLSLGTFCHEEFISRVLSMLPEDERRKLEEKLRRKEEPVKLEDLLEALRETRGGEA